MIRMTIVMTIVIMMVVVLLLLTSLVIRNTGHGQEVDGSFE